MIPLYLLLENFMSHSRSELDFSQFDLALIIGMENDDPDVSNGIGKTALFDAVRWALFGKCRFRTKKRIIKRGKVTCTVTFVFQLHNETYKIVRKMSQRATSSEVSFLIKEGNKWRDLSCDTSTGTNDKIEELIKLTHDTFINSVYFKQNDILQFASATASQKKDILKESLQIEVWDKYQEKAKEVVRRLSAQLSLLDDRIKSFGDLDREMLTNKTALKNLKEQIDKTQDEVVLYTNELEDARIKASKVIKSDESTEEQLSMILTRVVAIKERKQAIIGELNKYKQAVIETQSDQISLEKRLLEAAHQILIISDHSERQKAEEIFKCFAPNRKIPSFVVFCDKLAQDKIALETEKKNSDNIALQLKQLLALEPGKKCPTCLSVLDDLPKILQQRKKRIKFLENTKQDVDALLEELIRAVVRQEKIVAKADSAAQNIEHIKSSFLQAKNQVNYLSALQSGLEEELQELIREEQDLKNKKTQLEMDGDAITIQQKIKTLSTELERLHQELVNTSMEFGNLQGHGEDIERRISERQTLLVQKPRIIKNSDVHSQLVKAFGKSGVPAIIMENVTDDLCNYANIILKQISDRPMSIDFITQKRTDSGSWTETFDISIMIDDEVNEFDDLSGGEQVRVAIAIRLALSNVLMRRMGSSVKFLLLDEVDQALDRRGIQALADALKILSKEFKILVITHNDGLRERFDHIITVQKGPTGSFLSQ